MSFTSHAGLTALLAAAASARPMTVDLPPTEAPFGLKAWVEAHKAAFPGNDVLGAEVGEGGGEGRARDGVGRPLCAPADATPLHSPPALL